MIRLVLSSLLVSIALAAPGTAASADALFFEGYYRYHAEQDFPKAETLLQSYLDQARGQYLEEAELLLTEIRSTPGAGETPSEGDGAVAFQVDERWETWAKERKQLEQAARDKQATSFWESACLRSKALYGRTVESYEAKKLKLEESALAYEKEAQKLDRTGDSAGAARHRQRAEGYRNEISFMPPVRDRIGWAGAGSGTLLFLAHDVTGSDSASSGATDATGQVDQVRKAVHQTVINHIEYLEQHDPSGCAYLLEQLTNIESALHSGRYEEAQRLMGKTLAAVLE